VKLLFLHGWGFDASLWDGLRRALAPIESIAWDRGYFGRPNEEPADGPILAIGHSLGSQILAADPPPGCIGLIAINGFDRFTGEGAVPRRAVDRMRSRFTEAPREVLDAFRMRCGAEAVENVLDERRLDDDLERLATGERGDIAHPLRGPISLQTPPFQRRGKGWFSVEGGSMPSSTLSGLRLRGESFGHADARTHPNPSLEREGLGSSLLVLHGGADPILPPEMRAAVFAGAPRHTLAEGGHL
jgi:pimeloyl-[acyl-carrier protein] methyl ester esterase